MYTGSQSYHLVSTLHRAVRAETLHSVEGPLYNLQVTRGMQYREFTTSLVSRDFDDVWKDPFRYIFSYYLYYYQKIKSPCRNCNRRSILTVLHTQPTLLNEGLALINAVFSPTSSTYQKLWNSQCLKIVDRRSLSKFDDITWPSCHFTDRFVF